MGQVRGRQAAPRGAALGAGARRAAAARRRPDDAGAAPFLEFINSWIQLTSVLNELSRSMGQPVFYPFVLSRAVVGKLQFVHRVIRAACADRHQNRPQPIQGMPR
ncbi:hypothetical protein EUB48_01110 [Rhodoferax sediminis]|uniref:Uncharacterized protein n=1 Tax=Rhodoferax sediminis TaxID=2509614 RepID=A0A515DGM1_9BURK|nr:putative zinc-binding metallopeptidase [Rhodoferax sediminis]QDL39576.1 hypothetical protein EUB48_01110 [Rhodoferax sediminis]